MASDQSPEPSTPAATPDTASPTTPAAPAPTTVGDGAVQPPTSVLAQAIAGLQDAQQAGHDRLLRVAAEYDNFKKRARRDLSDGTRRAEEKVVLEFLPVLDNLERALAHAPEQAGGLSDGMRMVHKQFLGTLEKYDIKPFVAVGQGFDPERHEAIQQLPAPEPAGTICQELQRGYTRGDRLVRPALVVISLGPAVPPEPAAAGGDAGGDGSAGTGAS